MRFCLWGWRKGWIQVGSREDRRAQGFLGLSASVGRVNRAYAEVMRQVSERLAPAMEAFARAVRESRLW